MLSFCSRLFLEKIKLTFSWTEDAKVDFVKERKEFLILISSVGEWALMEKKPITHEFPSTVNEPFLIKKGNFHKFHFYLTKKNKWKITQ